MFSSLDLTGGKLSKNNNDFLFRMLRHEYSFIGGRKTTAYANNGNRIMLGDISEMLMGLLPVYANKLEFVILDNYNPINENTAGLHDRLFTNLRLSAELLMDSGILLMVTNKTLYRIIKTVTEEVFGSTNLIAGFTNRMCSSVKEELQYYLLFNKGCMEVQTTAHLNRCFSGKRFSNMLPEDLVRYCLHTACSKDAIVLNAIGGGDTMAAAVLYLNRQDKGNRKFLLLCPSNCTSDHASLQRMLASETDFDCYIPGKSPFTNGACLQLNTEVPAKQIREYIWYKETGVGFIDNGFLPSEPYLLGIQNNTAIYLMYEYNVRTVLNRAFLSSIKTAARQYIVYAHQCTLSLEQLQYKKIQFKQIQ